MSWLDRELEDKHGVLMNLGGALPYRKSIIISQVIRAAYEGGFEDGAGELEVTRALLKDAAERTVRLVERAEAAEAMIPSWRKTTNGHHGDCVCLTEDLVDELCDCGLTRWLEALRSGFGVEPPEPDPERREAPRTATERRLAGGSYERASWPSVGTRVRTRRQFAGVPKGTEGVVDQDYGSGVMVAWDLQDRPLPPDYALRYTVSTFKPQMAAEPGAPLRDGFDKRTELDMLSEVTRMLEEV